MHADLKPGSAGLRATGFTLIEILVALAILGLALGTVFVGFRTGARGMAEAAGDSASLATARSLLAAEGTAVPLTPGTTSGTTADGAAWRIVTTRRGTPDDIKSRLIAAYRVDITVTRDQRTEFLSTILPGPVAHAP